MNPYYQDTKLPLTKRAHLEITITNIENKFLKNKYFKKDQKSGKASYLRMTYYTDISLFLRAMHSFEKICMLFLERAPCEGGMADNTSPN